VFQEETRRKGELISLSLLLGLSIATVLNVVLLRAHMDYGKNLEVFLLSVTGCVLLVTVSSINNQIKRFQNFVKKLLSIQSRVTGLIKYLPMLSYLLLFFIWVYNLNDIDALALVPAYGRLESIGYWYVPIYIFPVRFGITGLIAVIGITYYSQVILKEPEYKPFISLIVVGLLSEQLMNYTRIYPAYRLATLTLTGLAPLAALAMIKLLFSSNMDKSMKASPILRILLRTLLIGIGVWSTCVFFINNILQFGG
jgi:hypothetical protein